MIERVRRYGRRPRNLYLARQRARALRTSQNGLFRRWADGLGAETPNPTIERRRKALLSDSTILNEAFDGQSGESVGDAARASKDVHAAMCLAAAVRLTNAESLIEVGTGLGISGGYMAAAMSPSGRLVTLDRSAARLTIAKETFAGVGVNDRVTALEGPFAKTLAHALSRLGMVDCAFIDGNHEYAPTLDYATRIAARSLPGSLLIVDDINYSPAMRAAWDQLASKPTFEAAVELHDMGALLVGRAD